MHDTWAARDLPVLEATVSLHEQSYMVTVTDIAAQTGLDVPAVARALEALDPVYVDFRKTTTGGDPRFWYVFKVTPEARRAVGQWPTAESLVSRLAEELAIAARQDGEAERHGLLVYAARLIGDTLKDVAIRAAEEVLRPAFASLPEPDADATAAAQAAEPSTGPAGPPSPGTSEPETPEALGSDLEPLRQAAPFPKSLESAGHDQAASGGSETGPAAEAVTPEDPDAADTDLDLAQAPADNSPG